MRNARGNARWVNDRGEFEGVELATWTNRVTVSGGSAQNTVEGVDFDPPPPTNRIAPSIRGFLHREHTLRRVLMRNGISGAFTVSFRFFSFSLFLSLPSSSCQFQPTFSMGLSLFLVYGVRRYSKVGQKRPRAQSMDRWMIHARGRVVYFMGWNIIGECY